MSTNSRFAVALHILTILAKRRDEWVTSAEIAGSVNTNPVVIRRILRNLCEGGLVEAVKGATGGFRLSRCPDQISLMEIHRSVEPGLPFALPKATPNPNCPVGACILETITPIFEAAQKSLDAELSRTSMATVLHDLNLCKRAH